MVPHMASMRVGSLVLVDRLERLSPEETARPNPLHLGDTLVYPNLGNPLSKKSDKQIDFFTNLYLPKGAQPTAVVRVMIGTQILKEIPLPLPAPDANGRIQLHSALPLEFFPPGTYVLKVVLSDGPATTATATSFTVTD
jgi:hypothetical protein